ncbi:hypothetical protein IWQ56_004505 [Coemansia nantahalensis]|nr:hypothetical protein IWQ56_004505 [Coemansia nantahalensis]
MLDGGNWLLDSRLFGDRLNSDGLLDCNLLLDSWLLGNRCISGGGLSDSRHLDSGLLGRGFVDVGGAFSSGLLSSRYVDGDGLLDSQLITDNSCLDGCGPLNGYWSFGSWLLDSWYLGSCDLLCHGRLNRWLLSNDQLREVNRLLGTDLLLGGNWHLHRALSDIRLHDGNRPNDGSRLHDGWFRIDCWHLGSRLFDNSLLQSNGLFDNSLLQSNGLHGGGLGGNRLL